jgi:hypothetical protein
MSLHTSYLYPHKKTNTTQSLQCQAIMLISYNHVFIIYVSGIYFIALHRRVFYECPFVYWALELLNCVSSVARYLRTVTWCCIIWHHILQLLNGVVSYLSHHTTWSDVVSHYESRRVVSHRIASYRIVSYRVSSCPCKFLKPTLMLCCVCK